MSDYRFEIDTIVYAVYDSTGCEILPVRLGRVADRALNVHGQPIYRVGDLAYLERDLGDAADVADLD